ncbi:hypothetical protein AVEN_271047-1 [Araneus ventricosus]|uniref:Integrase zinc-binding domain-containing protein n=1 Tax=Araneus ventricosus TaxID=182803 RepID=A0A4Y2FC76_ARAVE|nr:hypothetical protein AVEN_271047-1 [Araneus ventricosus]
MNQRILYRYSPEVETEQAQLVVPFQERERVLQQYHDVPTAGQYGAERTYNKVASRYNFTGMRKYIAEYVKTVQTVAVTNRVTRSEPVCLELQFIPKGLKPLLLIFLDLFQRPHLVRRGFF